MGIKKEKKHCPNNLGESWEKKKRRKETEIQKMRSLKNLQ